MLVLRLGLHRGLLAVVLAGLAGALPADVALAEIVRPELAPAPFQAPAEGADMVFENLVSGETKRGRFGPTEGMLTRFTSVSTGIGFNLGNSLWFALTAVGTYSLIYNLTNRSTADNHRFLPALLGPLMTLISGNLAGFLEILHSRHIFWPIFSFI